MADGISTDTTDLKNLISEVAEPFDDSVVKDVLDNFSTKLVNDLKTSLSRKGKKASGNLYDSINVEVKLLGNDYNLVVKMADYWNYVDKGRKPGKQPPISSIVKWIRNKPSFGGLGNKKPESVAFGIAKKIGKFGIKPTNFYTKVINDGRLIKLEEDIAEAIKNNLIK